MKKIVLVLFVSLLAISSAFAGFDKSNLNINARCIGKIGFYGVSYELGKWEVGAEFETETTPIAYLYYTLTDSYPNEDYSPLLVIIPGGGTLYGSYKVVSTEKSDLYVGGYVFLPAITASGLFAEYNYKIDEHNSVSARICIPPMAIVAATELPSIGYRYSF